MNLQPSLARYHKRRRGFALWLCMVLGLLMALNIAFPPPVKAARQLSSMVTDSEGRMLSAFTIEDGTWRLPARLDHIDPRFIQRLLLIEDKRFYSHSGVDMPAIARAARSWHRQGEAVSGASTLTMQLIRQLEPRPRRLSSKIVETLRAVQIEFWLSKDEILEAYLSHIPYGGNIEGIEAATRLYFGKSARYLTDGEIALLISLPQAPEARRPDARPKQAVIGRDIILAKLHKSGALSGVQYREAIDSPVKAQRSKMSDSAWITAHGLVKKNLAKKNSNPVIQSTLDGALQTRLEAQSAAFIKGLPEAVNTAITLVDNKTMQVRAHIASADRTRPGGWIDMTTRGRSPGSTLKPFIYGMAMDDGTISACSFAHDAPTRFGSYRPENFDRRYHGKVRIYEALRHSLNVPAVATLDKVGGKRFEQTLLGAGVSLSGLGGGTDAGLALALGGVGMSVNDVALLYAALANGGQARALRWTNNDKETKADKELSTGYSLMSRESAAAITKILAQAPTPDGRIPGWLTQGGVKLAYKTGTSYGFRDAWAAGYTDDWTVVVWVGRPDGAPRPGATGRMSAAPLLFDIFASLPKHSMGDIYRKDDDAPLGLQTLERTADVAPHILFPPDGAEVFSDSFGAKVGSSARGFTISARAQGGDYTAYIDGVPLIKQGRHYVWKPESAGFFKLAVIDKQGRQSTSRVRVITSHTIAN